MADPGCWHTRFAVLGDHNRFNYKFNWVLDWSPRSTNAAADLAAKLTLDSGDAVVFLFSFRAALGMALLLRLVASDCSSE